MLHKPLLKQLNTYMVEEALQTAATPPVLSGADYGQVQAVITRPFKQAGGGLGMSL